MRRRNQLCLFITAMAFICAFMVSGWSQAPSAQAAIKDFTITTSNATSISEDSALLRGYLKSTDYVDLDAYGFVYGESYRDVADNEVEALNLNEGTGYYAVKIDDLDPDQKYYYRAFAVIDRETIYGDIRSFTTEASGPAVTTDAATGITFDSARLNAEIDSEGDSLIREYGFYYGTTSATKTKKRVGTRIDEGDDFRLSLTDLKANTKYYFKAYARNEQGTAFGTVRSFTTQKVLLPEVTTRTTTTGDGFAILNGVVTDKGGSSIESYGFYYGTSSNPTTKIKVGNSIAEDRDFSYHLTGLDPNRTYYVKAYATNKDGTGYGKVHSFTMIADRSPSVFIINSSWYNIQGSNQLGDAAPYIKNNRTYLPIRPVGKAVGLNDADIIWNPTFQTVTLSGKGNIVHLTIGSRTMFVNGNPVVMDVAPEITSDRACLPIAHVVKAFGSTAVWDGNARSVTIR